MAIKLEAKTAAEKLPFSQEQLKKLIVYDPETGAIRRRFILYGQIADITTKTTKGYIKVKIRGKNYMAHRIAYFYMTGEEPEQVDHIDHDESNNKWSNLRAATNSQNNMNKGLQVNNSSGVRGIYWDKQKERWRAAIELNGVRINIGSFKEKDAAAAAVSEVMEICYKEFNYKGDNNGV